MKCLSEGCEKEAKVRGLCRPCYQAAYIQVQRGKVTWKQLADAKLAIIDSGRGSFQIGLNKALKDGRI